MYISGLHSSWHHVLHLLLSTRGQKLYRPGKKHQILVYGPAAHECLPGPGPCPVGQCPAPTDSTTETAELGEGV